MKTLEVSVIVAVIFVVSCLLSSCCVRRHVEYYPPTEEYNVVVENEKGERVIRGAIKSEVTEEEFTLGTGRMDGGSRSYLPINIGNVN